MTVVLFLQNAWSPLYAGGTWPRPSWIRALKASRSGQRLKHLINDFEVCENTTPIVGSTPDSILPPDELYIEGILQLRTPQIVIACGKQAEAVLLKLWKGPLLIVPHPAHRLVTNELYAEGRRLLGCDFKSRLALRQGRGVINQVPIRDSGLEPK